MGSRLGRGELVTVFGGSGFVGRYAVRALAREGLRVRAAVRRPDLAGHLQPMGAVGQVQPVQANLRYPDSIGRALQGSKAVVIAVGGGLAPTGRQTFKALFADGPELVAKAAREAGVERIVLVSALGANPRGRSQYARAKALGETAMLKVFPSGVILRPSVVFGPEDQFFNRFAAMAQYSPVLPLIGGGRTRFQPVFVGDVANAVVAGVQGLAIAGTTYELGGPQIFSFRQLLDQIQGWTERERGYLPMPFWLASLSALLSWPLPNGIRPLTLDQVRLLRSDNVVSQPAIDDKRTLTALGIDSPLSIGSIVPGYLERFKRRGQFSHYRG